MVSGLKILLFFLLVVNCGNPMFKEIQSFKPNVAPVVTSFSVKDQNSNDYLIYVGEKKTFSSTTQIFADQVFFITTVIDEKESNLVTIKYSANSYYNPDPAPAPDLYDTDGSYICSQNVASLVANSANMGLFNNQVQSEDFEKTVTATATFVVPNKATIPHDSDIYITVTVTDEKNADTTFTKCLGPVKRRPIMQLTTPYVDGSTSDTVSWKANSSGSFIFYSKANAGDLCFHDITQVNYPYIKGNKINRNDVLTSPFCIVIYDSLGQFDCFDSETTDPVGSPCSNL